LVGKRKLCPVFYVRGFNAPYNEGGITFLNNIVNALNLRKIQCVISNFKYNSRYRENENFSNSPAKIFEQSIPLISREQVLYENGKSMIFYSSLMESLAMLKFLKLEKRLKHNCGEIIVNLVNCFTYPRIFLQSFFSSPVVLHVHTRSTAASFRGALFDRSDMVFASSQTVANCIARIHNVKRQKIKVIYPPVDTILFAPAEKIIARSLVNLPEKAKVLLYMGNLRNSRFPEDSVLQIVKDIIKETPDTLLLIIASESERNIQRALQILEKVRNLNLRNNVRLIIKNLSDSEKSMIYNASDVFLYPSLASSHVIEPPLTIIEAMSCGLPVISSRVSSVDNIITNRVEGIIAEDISQFSERIPSLLADRELMMRLSSNARRSAIKNTSLISSCNKLLEAYNGLEHLHS
jgi:glycosyltransferase involved in cell wall biosynthesis